MEYVGLAGYFHWRKYEGLRKMRNIGCTYVVQAHHFVLAFIPSRLVPFPGPCVVCPSWFRPSLYDRGSDFWIWPGWLWIGCTFQEGCVNRGFEKWKSRENGLNKVVFHLDSEKQGHRLVIQSGEAGEFESTRWMEVDRASPKPDWIFAANIEYPCRVVP